MAQNKAPAAFDNFGAFVDAQRFSLTDQALNRLNDLWRQVVAGFVVVPCVVTQTTPNTLQLIPLLNSEGGNSYGNGMGFWGKAIVTTTGAATGFVGKQPTVNLYKSPGLVQIGAGDIVAGGLYFFMYESSLNSNAGGFVVK